MSFDKPTRNALARMVGAVRERLRTDITAQLQSTYRLQPDGVALPLDGLTEDQRAAALDLRVQLEHFARLESAPDKQKRAAAFDRLVREIGFTVLNRLAALRLCEERGLVVECVRQGTASEGFRLFDRLANGALGARYETYRVFLENLFDELALDLGVLFDRNIPLSQVFPSERALEDVLDRLNDPALAHLWTEDETIGWIYQYYNDESERRKMRDESHAPRNSRELAVRNQFFTPRYVVEFLTDNTLGRIWYEMRRGNTVLKEQCRYLVLRPEENLPTENRESLEKDRESSLIPGSLSPRSKKDPREILMLDPAGGSGHFGLYCFDLFETIYAEAYDDPELGANLQAGFPDRAEFLRQVPRLILAHNIHIIDIDPRACQIAALALWLRAQRSFQKMGLKPQERPQIKKVNVVCAEPMPGERELLEEFVAYLNPRELGELVCFVFERMHLAGEAGSLLKIEEELREKIEELKRKVGPLFARGDFWDDAEERVLNTLKEYAERASNGGATRRRLFADDTVRGFALINLCQKRYDAILMNPPFGESTPILQSLISTSYPSWNKNLLCAFIESAAKRLALYGCCGVIFDRTAINKSTYESFRRTVLLADNHLRVCADLGWEVLDANVELFSCVFGTQALLPRVAQFFDVRDIAPGQKADILCRLINSGDSSSGRIHALEADLFLRFPNAAIIYELSPTLISAFSKFRALKEHGFVAYTGHQLQAERHFRLYWERNLEQVLSPSNRFTFLYNGGEYSRFAIPPRDIVRFGAFSVLSSEDFPSYSYRIQNKEQEFLKGVGFGVRGEFLDAHLVQPRTLFTVEGQVIPLEREEDIWFVLAFLNSVVAQRLLNTISGQHKYSGYVNLLPVPPSSTADLNLLDVSARKSYEIMELSYTWDETCLTFLTPIIFRLFWSNLANAAQQARDLVDTYERELEECYASINTHFYELYAVATDISRNDLENYQQRIPRSSLPEWSNLSSADIAKRISFELLSYSLGLVLGLWDIRIISNQGVVSSLQNPFEPLPNWPPSVLIGPNSLPATPGNIVSEEWLHARPNAITLPPEGSVRQPTIPDSEYPIRIAWDGILVDDPGLDDKAENPHPNDIVRRVREVLNALWNERTDTIEAEACEILGVTSLREYFRKPSGFFGDHLKRYSKSRRQAPIYWPLSTASGRYSIWLYYHRLTRDTLYTVVNQYLDPKIESVQKRADQFTEKLKDASGRAATDLRDQLSDTKEFLGELQDMRAELLYVAALPYKPNLNDGVIINAAPLNKLFRLRKWANDTAAVWKKLEAGEYDWAHLAYTTWPKRVEKVCETDRSIAIAHGLERLCKVEVKRGKGKKQESVEEEEDLEIDLG